VPPERVSTFYDLVWIVGVNDFVLKFISGNTLNKLHGVQEETIRFSFGFAFAFSGNIHVCLNSITLLKVEQNGHVPA
jgi:hypothetical protein